ncbi:unnamed protein product [Effrenium voratum]|uniref:J domain-containing protein n=1 Tax=Effrenium voratum TaxID=2562239 RepID=A0AA36J9U8_9DINO|nr:unnamed protein product [Effrenium voratum]CAJ1417462.1 unnamed protein product [Effrenium voratum]
MVLRNFLGRVQDPFAVLGLKRAASSDQVKRAYHGLCRKYHPDKDRSVPAHLATARFQRIKAAYELLSHPSNRLAAASTVVSAPFKPNRSTKGTKGSKSAKAAKQKPKQQAKKQSQPAKRRLKTAPATDPEILEILDSDDEAPANPRMAKRASRAKMEASKQQERDRKAAAAGARMRARAQRLEAGGDGDARCVRLVFKAPPDFQAEAVAAAWNSAEVLRFEPGQAILAMSGAKEAVALALSFHAWPARQPVGLELQILRQMSLAVAPVDYTGRAAGPKTLVVSRSLVAASDGTSSKLL